MRKLKIAQIGVRHEHADGKMSTVRLQMSDIFEVVGIAPIPFSTFHRLFYTIFKYQQVINFLSRSTVFEYHNFTSSEGGLCRAVFFLPLAYLWFLD